MGCDWLFEKIAHSSARLVLEEVTRWKNIVKDNACGPFVDQLHLELSAMKLGILIPNAEDEVGCGHGSSAAEAERRQKSQDL